MSSLSVLTIWTVTGPIGFSPILSSGCIPVDNPPSLLRTEYCLITLQKLAVVVTDSALSIAVAADEGSREFTTRDGTEFFEQDEAVHINIGGTSTLADKGWVTITFERA